MTESVLLGLMQDLAEIDVCCQVLPTDPAIELLGRAVLVVSLQRSSSAMIAEELLRRVAVIDDHRESPEKRLTGRIHPLLEPGVVFEGLAGLQFESVPSDVVVDLLVDRRPLTLDEPAIGPVDENLLQPIFAHHDTPGGKGVEEFVRQHASRDAVIWRGQLQTTGMIAISQVFHKLAHARLIQFDRDVLDSFVEIRVFLSKLRQKRPDEPAGTGSVFDNAEWLRMIEIVVELEDLPGEGGAENRMRFRGGQEIAGPSWRRVVCAIVPMFRMIEREFHEPVEPDLALIPDLIPNDRDKFSVAFVPEFIDVRHTIRFPFESRKLSLSGPPRRIIRMNSNDCTNKERPITEQRLKRMRSVLRQRQPDLTVVIEDVHDPHNISAVLRSCDAVGVNRVHLVYKLEEEPQLSKGVSASALKWLELERHDTIQACYDRLRQDGFGILATALRDDCHDLHALDMTMPTALVFGNENRGCSDEAVDEADGAILIPMMGMVQSLNISVACAVTLYEALRQRRVSGDYDEPKLPEQIRRERLDYWLRRDRRKPLSDLEPV